MRFHSITLSAGAALALALCATAAVGKPARKPATAAAPAKPAKPSQKFSDTFPEAAAGPEAEAAAAAIGDAEPAAEASAPAAEEVPATPVDPPPEAIASEAAPPAEAAAARPSEAAPPEESPTEPASEAKRDAPDVPASDAPAASAAAAVPKKGEPPTRAFMVGIWAEPGKSCETALDFKADGTLIGPFPRWELDEAGGLTMVGNRQKIMLKVLDKDTLQSRRSETDPPRTLKRC